MEFWCIVYKLSHPDLFVYGAQDHTEKNKKKVSLFKKKKKKNDEL